MQAGTGNRSSRRVVDLHLGDYRPGETELDVLPWTFVQQRDVLERQLACAAANDQQERGNFEPAVANLAVGIGDLGFGCAAPLVPIAIEAEQADRCARADRLAVGALDADVDLAVLLDRLRGLQRVRRTQLQQDRQ